MVSENAVVICDEDRIYLYHIPELNSAEHSSTLSPVWECPGEPKWLCGSVHKTPSHHPVLYLQSSSGTHTITFRMDACGRDPVVVRHHITGKLPAHLTCLEEEKAEDDRFVMKGRKGLYYNVEGDSSPNFSTCLVGREELAGGFHADVDPLSCVDPMDEHEVRLADFDERTGRILIGTGPYFAYEKDKGIRIYLADLPP